MKEKFNYDIAYILEKYDSVDEIPIKVLKELNIYSKNQEEFQENLEWLEENFEAIKAGYKDNNDLEEDIMNMMYPEGYDPDVDNNLFDD